MTDDLYRELTAAARRLGFTDEVVGRLRPLFRVAYEKGFVDGSGHEHQRGNPTARPAKEKR